MSLLIPEFRALAVPRGCDGMRLDRMLSRWFRSRSRHALAKAIRRSQVSDSTGRVLRCSTRLREGQVLHIAIPGIAPTRPVPPIPPIVFEDDRVIALNKPAQLIVHPAGSEFVWSVIGLARLRWPDHPVSLVHRLDRDTSGVLLLAKDVSAKVALSASFSQRQTVKEYVAIVKGCPSWDSVSFTQPIGRAGGRIRIQMAVRSDGQTARTDVQVLARRSSPDWSLVRCTLHTGRTHQIRVHLSHAGFPVLGDRLYGVPEEHAFRGLEEGVDEDLLLRAGAPFHLLHSAHLAVAHPEAGRLDLKVDPPAHFMQRWKRGSVF